MSRTAIKSNTQRDLRELSLPSRHLANLLSDDKSEVLKGLDDLKKRPDLDKTTTDILMQLLGKEDQEIFLKALIILCCHKKISNDQIRELIEKDKIHILNQPVTLKFLLKVDSCPRHSKLAIDTCIKICDQGMFYSVFQDFADDIKESIVSKCLEIIENFPERATDAHVLTVLNLLKDQFDRVIDLAKNSCENIQVAFARTYYIGNFNRKQILKIGRTLIDIPNLKVAVESYRSLVSFVSEKEQGYLMESARKSYSEVCGNFKVIANALQQQEKASPDTKILSNSLKLLYSRAFEDLYSGDRKKIIFAIDFISDFSLGEFLLKRDLELLLFNRDHLIRTATLNVLENLLVTKKQKNYFSKIITDLASDSNLDIARKALITKALLADYSVGVSQLTDLLCVRSGFDETDFSRIAYFFDNPDFVTNITCHLWKTINKVSSSFLAVFNIIRVLERIEEDETEFSPVPLIFSKNTEARLAGYQYIDAKLGSTQMEFYLRGIFDYSEPVRQYCISCILQAPLDLIEKVEAHLRKIYDAKCDQDRKFILVALESIRVHKFNLVNLHLFPGTFRAAESC